MIVTCLLKGGGTGSGLGTYILNLLADHFPDAYRFATVVTPSTAGTDNDVVTSPYNTILALAQLSEHADCVMPVDNRALADITTRVQQAAAGKAKGKVVLKGSAVDGAECEGAERERKQRAFDTMNAVVANVMLNVTA